MLSGWNKYGVNTAAPRHIKKSCDQNTKPRNLLAKPESGARLPSLSTESSVPSHWRGCSLFAEPYGHTGPPLSELNDAPCILLDQTAVCPGRAYNSRSSDEDRAAAMFVVQPAFERDRTLAAVEHRHWIKRHIFHRKRPRVRKSVSGQKNRMVRDMQSEG